MPGYGVANPGSLIGFVFLFIAFQLQYGQCALPNSLPLFVQARGVFLGACNFIATCFNATANAPFGSSLHSGNATCHSRRKCRQRRRAGAWAVVLTPQTTAAGCSWVWVRFGLGIASLLLLRFRLVNCFACLLAALAWLAALVPFPVWVLRLNRIPRLLSVWFIARRGHHFVLGTGGLKLSLLVGGLGPVYSLPKYCFKPFRTI